MYQRHNMRRKIALCRLIPTRQSCSLNSECALVTFSHWDLVNLLNTSSLFSCCYCLILRVLYLNEISAIGIRECSGLLCELSIIMVDDEAVRITPQLAQCIPSAQAYAVSKIRNSVLIATAMSWCWNIFCRLYGEIKVFFRQIIHLRDSFSLIEQRLPHTTWASKWNTMPFASVYLQNKFHDPQDLHLFPMSSLLSNYNEILI